MQTVTANLRNLADPKHYAASDRYEGFQAGGGGMVQREQVSRAFAAIHITDGAIGLRFDRSDGKVEATTQVLELPASWKGYNILAATVEAREKPLTLELTVVGARSRLTHQALVEPGRLTHVAINLVDLPLTAGIRAAYEPPAVRFVGLWDGDEKLTDYQRATRGSSKDLGDALPDVPPASAEPHELIVHELKLVPREEDAKPRPCVDRFGQRINAMWPTKVNDENQLLASRDRELQDLAELPAPTDRDAFGGWTGGPTFDATGFFYVHQVDGVWWMVDPLGNPFYSIGTTGVRTTDNTIPDGREELYQELPPKDGRYASVWLDPTQGSRNDRGGKMQGISFYRWNILRKYGSKEGWRDRVCARFKKWGFNTIANWSEDVMLDQEMVPHVRATQTRDDRFPLITRQFADVFDPQWAKLLDEKFAEEVAPFRDNPWVLGFFVDNESHWRNCRLLTAPRDFAVRHRWREFCKEQFGNDLAACGKAFGRTFSEWDEVASMEGDRVADDGTPGQEVMTKFEALFAETMFEGVKTTLKKHAPNHLYLGCRFVRAMPHPSIVEANGRHADVVSINCYDLYPRPAQFDVWYAVAGRPLMMGEHHFPLLSPRQLPPLYAAFTAEERGPLYVQFIREWASRPYSVGDHWFQHADQAATGRGMDGENQTVGFVDIADQPHRELVEAAREATANLYQWHAASGAYELHADAKQYV